MLVRKEDGEFAIRMKIFFLLSLILLFTSCSQTPPLKSKSPDELADFIMKESLLDAALTGAIGASRNSIRPFESNVTPENYKRIEAVLANELNFQKIHSAIRKQLVTQTERKQLLEMAEKLESDTWREFVAGLKKADTQEKTQFNSLYMSIENGNFNLQSPRAAIVARIADYAYLLNLVKLTNDQVVRMIASEAPKDKKREGLITFIKMELNTFNDAHIKGLFANTWLATENFEDHELVELLGIRGHDVIKLLRASLETELTAHYNQFFEEVRELTASSSR